MAAIERAIPMMATYIGQTRGSTEVAIRARIEGYLETMDFKEGSTVKKGDLLYTIDAKPFRAKLAEAKANLAQAQAKLAQAKQDVAKYTILVASNAISRQQYDTAVSQQEAAAAAVEAANAAVEQAEISLSYTRIHAPVGGMVGKSDVQPGKLITAGPGSQLTTIVQTHPLHVRFNVSERDFLQFVQRRRNPDSDLGAKPTYRLELADGSFHASPGHINFADNTVDPSTGTLLLEVAFPNEDALLRPGQYAKVHVSVDRKTPVVLVPQKAVQELQATYTVYIVKGDNQVEARAVKAGQRVGAFWVIDEGIKAGETVIVEGLQKVRAGSTVVPQPVEIPFDVPAAAPEA
jgi:membrane fusion protein (multidrug efflux system)